MKEKLKRVTIKVPKKKVYFVNARETHFHVLSKLLFRLLDEIFSLTFSYQLVAKTTQNQWIV